MDDAVSSLYALYQQGQIGSGYLFYGQNQSLLLDHALSLSTLILANKSPYPQETVAKFVQQRTHPNFFILDQEGDKDILTEDTKALTAFLQSTPTLPTWRCIIIHQAQKLNQSASNALLKSIEELPQKTLLILTAPGLTFIKPTILSRVQKIFFSSPSVSLKTFLQSCSEAKALLPYLQKASLSPNDKIDEASISLLKKMVLLDLYEKAQEDPCTYSLKYEAALKFIINSEGKSLSPTASAQALMYLINR